MEKIINRLDQIDVKALTLRKVCKQNNIDPTTLNGFNTKKMRDIHQRLVKHYKDDPQKGKTLWFQSELKLFNWTLLSYSHLFQKKVQEFTQRDWDYFKQIFLTKDSYTFKYQSKKLCNQNSKNSRLWNTEEEQILTTIMDDNQMLNRWNQVARRFYDLSDQKFFRTGKQCREHWINHLDPSKKHGKWTLEQDKIILKFVISKGKKWSTISKQELYHRTQHMIKNRFKSIIVKYQKTLESYDADENLTLKKLSQYYGIQQESLKNTFEEFKYQKTEKSEQKMKRKQSQKTVKLQHQDLIISKNKVSEVNIPQINNQNFMVNQQQIQIFKEETQQRESFSPYYSSPSITYTMLLQPWMLFMPFSYTGALYSQNIILQRQM